MSHAEYSHHPVEWRVQPDALLNQAAPVQNTWYTVLTTLGYTFIDFIVIAIQTTGETIFIEVIIDGITKVTEIAAVAGTNYTMSYNIGTLYPDSYGSNAVGSTINHVRLMGHAVRVRVRKTTALGAGNLQCHVKYSEAS